MQCLGEAFYFMIILFILMFGFSLSQYFRAIVDPEMEN
jgi:hypothetical protein